MIFFENKGNVIKTSPGKKTKIFQKINYLNFLTSFSSTSTLIFKKNIFIRED